MPTLSIYATGLLNPQDVDLDSSGNLYVALGGQNAIVKLPPVGSGKIGAGAQTVVNVGQTPSGVATDNLGNVFSVFQTSHTLYKNGVPFLTDPNINLPTGVGTDTSNNIYISCAGNNSIIYVSAT